MPVADPPKSPAASPSREREAAAAAWPGKFSPHRLLLLLALLVFVGESLDMLLLRHMQELPWGLLTLIDAGVLLLLLSPAYLFLYRPLKTHYTERRRAEQEVSFLSRHVIRAVEEEKKRLAHDLHDECGQMLTALQFGIETLKHSLPKESAGAAQQCDRLASLTAQLADQVRSLTAQLRPAMLESCGLVPTLRWHLEQMGEGMPDLRIDLQAVGGGERLPPEIEITVYRLCQEGLTNIVRHAKASRVKIQMSHGERLLLRIEDDGVGFDPRRTPRCDPVPQGFGLLGMRERVADLGGRLTVRSAPGEGTVIEADLPLVVKGEGA